MIQMIDIIRQFRPERIYLPYAKDQHPDHQNTYQMVVKAARYASFSGFAQCQYKKEWQTKELLCYEIWTPMEHVDFTEDITEYIEDKRRAMREHKSQLEKRDYDAALLGLNRYRGVISKKGKYCEAFKIVS